MHQQRRPARRGSWEAVTKAHRWREKGAGALAAPGGALAAPGGACLSPVLTPVFPVPSPPSFVAPEQACWVKERPQEFEKGFPEGGNVLGLQKLREAFG